MTKILKNNTVRLFLGAIVLYIGILFYIPQAGVVRSIPIIFVTAAISRFFLDDLKTVFGFGAGISAVLYCMYGHKLWLALVFGLLCGVVSLCGAFVLDCIKKRAVTGGKKRLTAVIIFVICVVVLYTVLCGNVFDAFGARRANLNYLDANYPQLVGESYTYYDVSDFSYKTCFAFDYNGEIVGNDGECFVSQKDQRLYDGIRERVERDIIAVLEKAASSAIAQGTDYYKILYSDIDFQEGEILSFEENPHKYASRAEYVVGLYAVQMEQDYFINVCNQVKAALDDSGFVSKKLTLVGASSDEVKYICFVNNDSDVLDIMTFDEGLLKDCGVTADSVLGYWLG